MKFSLFFMAIAAFMITMATSCKSLPVEKLPISDETKISVAIDAGCAAATTAGCFGEPASIPRESDTITQLLNLLGKISTVTDCSDGVKRIISEKAITIDIGAMTQRKFTCKDFATGIGLISK